MTTTQDHYPTPEQMYAPGVPHYKLDLIAHVHRGVIRFSTPDEYGGLGRTGAPRWTGTIAVIPEGNGAAYAPGIDERLMNTDGYDDALKRVLAEGTPVDV